MYTCKNKVDCIHVKIFTNIYTYIYMYMYVYIMKCF